MVETEENGITALRNFIAESRILRHYLTENDRTPLIDGSICVYKDEHTTYEKQYILGTVHVQVKSSQRKTRKSESFPLSLSDLKAYQKFGGVVLLRPIFQSTTDYKIFYKNLLPVDLEKLANLAKPGQKKKSILLEKLESIEHLEKLLKYFLNNSKHQATVPGNIKGILKKGDVKELVIKTLDNPNDLSVLFSKNTYVYLVSNCDTLVATALSIDKIAFLEPVSICVGGRNFFAKTYAVMEQDKSRYLVLNPCIWLVIEERQYCFKLKNTEDSLLSDWREALDFYEQLRQYESFFLNNVKFEFKNYQKEETGCPPTNWTDLFTLADRIRADLTRVKTQDVEKNKDLIDLLIAGLLRNEKVILHETEQDTGKRICRVLERTILLSFNKVTDDRYTMELYAEEVASRRPPPTPQDGYIPYSPHLFLYSSIPGH